MTTTFRILYIHYLSAILGFYALQFDLLTVTNAQCGNVGKDLWQVKQSALGNNTPNKSPATFQLSLALYCHLSVTDGLSVYFLYIEGAA